MDRVEEKVCEDPDAVLRKTKDETYRLKLLSLFRELKSQASSNCEYFRQWDGSGDVDPSKTRLFEAYCLLREHIDRGVQPGVEYLISIAHFYDVDSCTMANGYRSFVLVVERCCQRLLALSRFPICYGYLYIYRTFCTWPKL